MTSTGYNDFILFGNGYLDAGEIGLLHDET